MAAPKVVVVPISIGELLDKISILAIKLEHVEDLRKRGNISHELNQLEEVKERDLAIPLEMHDVLARLRLVNSLLWDVEEFLRRHEESEDFGPMFVALARSVYLLNDERARLKRVLNHELCSGLCEEKSYQ